MTKNQPMAVPVWLSESLGIWQQYTLTGDQVALYNLETVEKNQESLVASC